MSFLKKIFSKKEEVKIEEHSGYEKCGLCNLPIFPNTPAKTFPKSGVYKKRYHIKCWRKLRKMGDSYQKTGKVVE